MQKELVLQFPKWKFSFTLFNQQSHTHSHSEAITTPPFSQVPRFPQLLFPSRELHEGDESPSWSRTWLGTVPGPHLILWPFLVGWSVPPMSSVGSQPSGESEYWSEREPGIPSGGRPPCSSQDFFVPTQPSHQCGNLRGQRGWNLAGASRNVAETSTQETKHHTQSWRAQAYYAGGPRGINPPSSGPWTKGLQSFYTWTGTIKQVCRGLEIAKSRTWVSEISSCS